MVNNKGYLRILEAVIASVLLLGIVLFINSKGPELSTDVPSQVVESQKYTLEKISLNETLRICISGFSYIGNCLTHSDTSCKDAFIDAITKNVPSGYSFACEICNTPLSCISSSAPPDTSVYTDARFFVDKTIERIVRLYYWR